MKRKLVQEVEAEAITAVEEPEIIPLSKHSQMADEFLTQFLLAAKERAVGVEVGRTMNPDTIDSLKALQEVVLTLHSIGVLKV